ncbi:MAG: KamA family radical SAM protein [Deltaproteobacteria bacterium]|nr:KamA family radical SAM protein [Deltaproteobacteria bacterium]
MVETSAALNHFENIQGDDWHNWRWQIENRIHTLSQLAGILNVSLPKADKYRDVIETYRFSVTPYYLSLIDLSDEKGPLRLQCFPDPRELDYLPGSSDDPLEEERDMVVPGLIHRYPDRCLAMVTNTCAAYCRHCNRKHRWKESETKHSRKNLQVMIDYVSRTKQVREVILSGGDPLLLNIETLEWLLHSLKSIPHVEVIRIGSRIPVYLPMRIDQDLCDILEKYRPLWFLTQFNHPREVTAEAARACNMLLRAGIPVMNQSVLLKGVNDSYEVMRDLLYSLQRISVKPYYLFQCEPVKGVDHFRVDIWKGMEIMEQLWRNISGLCLPRYVFDLPGGRGKMPLQPFSCL